MTDKPERKRAEFFYRARRRDRIAKRLEQAEDGTRGGVIAPTGPRRAREEPNCDQTKDPKSC